tara:strand:+ start:199 stop:1473 length:1275 start_codon:yes stop_codon:yes gene_type:complete
MKKILIITYYWPPKGGVGVQRWLKLSKYLAKESCELIIYTSDGGEVPLVDTTLLESVSSKIKVIKISIFEPQKILKLFSHSKPSSDILIKKKPTFLENFFIFLRANLFVPDSRSLWINKSVSFLDNYLRNNSIDVVISTGPPHSMHIIANHLKQKYNFNWIADFRDPWTNIEYFDTLPLLSCVKKKHQKLEKKIICNADVIMSVSSSWAKSFEQMGAKRTFVLPNGYDPDDYQLSVKKSRLEDFKIGHFGLYNELRDHSIFWTTINELIKTQPNFKSNLSFFFAGETYTHFLENIKSYDLFENFEYFPYLNHSDTIQNMLQCDLLLITQGSTKSVLGRIPAKVFEYLKARKPILVIGKKNSDLDKLLSNISYAWFIDFNQPQLLKDAILEIYNLRTLNHTFDDDISCFSRVSHAKKIIELINDL